MITDINSEDRLVQQTFAEHLHKVLGWESVYAFNNETFGPAGTLGRTNEREVVLVRDLRAALEQAEPGPARRRRASRPCRSSRRSISLARCSSTTASSTASSAMACRSSGATTKARCNTHRARSSTSATRTNNRFLAVRELKIQGVRVPHYNRRADLVCFVNGLPLVFIELKAVYKNIRAGFDDNLTDYMDEHSIAHAFHHNAFLVVSNGDHARYGSITSKWEHFVEWKRNDEKDKGSVDAAGPPRRHARQRPAARPRRELHPVRRQPSRRHAQDRRPQPSGAGRQQRGRVGRGGRRS